MQITLALTIAKLFIQCKLLCLVLKFKFKFNIILRELVPISISTGIRSF